MEVDEEVREFLIECNENLLNLDREVVLLEQNPKDAKLIASVFRTIHTIKGTCGFFGFSTLGAVSHVAENILDQVRSQQRDLTSELISLLLEAVDAIKSLLSAIEADGQEGTNDYKELRARLTSAYEQIAPKTAAPARQSVLLQPLAAPAVSSIPAPTPASIPSVTAASSAPGVAPVVLTILEEPAAAPVAQAAGAPAAQPTAAPVAAAKPETDSANAVAPKNSVVVDSTIRVDVGLLDKLMNLVGELVLARNQLLQGSSGQDAALIRTVQRLNVITSELQEGVLKTRMQPIGVVWNKLPRVIRDLAAECGKKIHIVMEGAETELDKTIIEAIKDPLTHIARNSCDHGIELPALRLKKGKQAEGVILLRAYHEGGHVNIEISDDGGGLDPERLKAKAVSKGLIRADQAAAMTEREAVHLVFLPGFSTAEQITKISGRGVGMDVVKTNIQKIGGIVDIYNRPGAHGSAVKIKIPLTLAIIPGLIIVAHGAAAESTEPQAEATNRDQPGSDENAQQEHRFVIPQANLLELVRLEAVEEGKQLEYVNGTPVYRRRGQLLPLAYLNSVLGMAGATFPVSGAVNIVVLQAEERPFGLVVDGILDTQEIVVKPLGKRLKGLSSYLGATIMGDGRVALILDVPGLARLGGIVSQARDTKRAITAEALPAAKQTFLIFRAGRFDRLAVPLSLVARLEQFPSRSIELASNRPVLHYRNEILPLIMLRHLLEPSTQTAYQPDPADADEGGTIQLIVFGEGGGRVGLVVDKIVDIIEESVGFTQASTHPGLLGSAVIGGTITDLIDLYSLLALSNEGPLGHGAHTPVSARLLLVEPSNIVRTMLTSYLSMRGFEIVEATGTASALEVLIAAQASDTSQANGRLNPKSRIDLIVASFSLGAETGLDLLKALRSRETLRTVPVLTTIPKNSVPEATIAAMLAATAEGVSYAPDAPLRFDAVDQSGDRVQLLKTIQTLLSQRTKPIVDAQEVTQ